MKSIIVIIYNILHNNNKSYEKSKGVYEYLNILKKKNYFYKNRVLIDLKIIELREEK